MFIDITLAPGEVITDVSDKARALAAELGVTLDYVDVWRGAAEGFDGAYSEALARKSPEAANRYLERIYPSGN